MCSPGLPAEVWTLVFGQLSLPDRLSVRASCKHFRDLVDDALWRTRTVELKRSAEEYEEHFWSTLRRWRVTSVRLSCPTTLAHIARELPGLTGLIIHYDYMPEWSLQKQDLKNFRNLKRLHLTHPTKVRWDELSPVLPQRLTKLRVCYNNFRPRRLPAQIPPDSPLKKLKSLVFHDLFNSHPANVLHFFLSSLPQLQRLSLRAFVHRNNPFEGHISDLPPLHNSSLTSLELLQCKTKEFPMDFMRMLSKLPFLRSLALLCHKGSDYCYEDESKKLSAWLRDLPALTSLTVECMYFSGFVGSIPSSVTRLTLRTYIDSAALTVLPATLPNVRHLHLDPDLNPDDPLLCRGSETALIPKLFPRLRTLCMPLHDFSGAFLCLASLNELELFEVLTCLMHPLFDVLVSKLRKLTNNRFRIYMKTAELWSQTCGCIFSIPTDDWE